METESISGGGPSRVEEYFLAQGGNPEIGPDQERIKVVAVDDYVRLGQLTALRFLEWSQENPEGVVALPTGRTPEYFIKWVRRYLADWNAECRDGVPAAVGLGSRGRPRLDGLRFVQLDEFFPIHPGHERSFAYFIRRFYFEGFGLDPGRALLFDTHSLPQGLAEDAYPHRNLQEVFSRGEIDLDLRVRQPANDRDALHRKILRRIDAFCEEYEGKIRSLGGIGFFLGGIGPDGHIAFNVRGSSHHSVTRLDRLNYESQAAASTDLGGIDAVRKKAVVTIGLGTITHRADAVAIIMAAGETKAPIVAAALERPPSIESPASCLQGMPNARFFLTRGAASRLQARRMALLAAAPSLSPRERERLAIDGALASAVPSPLAGPADAAASGSPAASASPEWRLASALSGMPIPDLLSGAAASIEAKIRRALHPRSEGVFLHTAPHHDDIELAYFPLIHHLVRSERHESHFCYLTSGFTAVTNAYLAERLRQLAGLLETGALGRKIPVSDLRDPATAQHEIHGYLQAIAGGNRDAEEYFTACRLSRYVFGRPEAAAGEAGAADYVRGRIRDLEGLEAGRPDPEAIQAMKGWLREWEAELVWAHFGLGRDHVHHLRLKFYTGAIFPEDPDYLRDVVPVLRLLEKVDPDVVTVAMDPEGSGPDTHFKVLIAVARALEEYVKIRGDRGLRIYGYRNVWSRYHIADADVIVPVSLNSFAVLDNMFNSCFVSQRLASFPSPEMDGTFSRLARKIWVEQHNDLVRLLGRGHFYDSGHPMLRRAYGAIYLKDMSYPEFRAEVEPIRALLDSKKMLSG